MPNTCFCAPCVKYFSMRPVWWSSLLQQHCMGWRKDVSISDKNLCYKIPRVKWFGWPDAQGIIDGSGCLLQRTPFVCFASKNHKFCGKEQMNVSRLYQVPTVKLTTTISLVHPTLYLMLEALIVCLVNPYYDIVVITNPVEPLIINLYKDLICLIPYFTFCCCTCDIIGESEQ